MTNVKGKSKAMPVAGPRPGSIPMTVPRKHPNVSHKKLDGTNTILSPYIKYPSVDTFDHPYGRFIKKTFSNRYQIPTV